MENYTATGKIKLENVCVIRNTKKLEIKNYSLNIFTSDIFKHFLKFCILGKF